VKKLTTISSPSRAENKKRWHYEFNFRVINLLKRLSRPLRPTVWRLIIAGLCCVMFSGCESVTYGPQATDPDGVPYFNNAPYLLVYSDGHGGLKWQIRYLPDQSRIMTVTPSVFISHAEINMNFQNGVLATSSTLGDSTEIPKSLIAAVQSALPLVGAAAMAGAQKNGFPAPYLYKIVVEGSSLKFVGGQADCAIQIPRIQGED
jgi:hypothetical protein